MRKYLIGSWPVIALWLLLLASDTGGQLSLKIGASSLADIPVGPAMIGAALAEPWIWAGLGCYVCSFLTWLLILRQTPLSFAFSMSGLAYVSILLAARLLLGEPVEPLRWIGAVVIVAGVTLLGSEEA